MSFLTQIYPVKPGVSDIQLEKAIHAATQLDPAQELRRGIQ
ncbi:MAG: hypothetical protein WCA10_08070 [Terracidiphilus sp.]